MYALMRMGMLLRLMVVGESLLVELGPMSLAESRDVPQSRIAWPWLQSGIGESHEK